MELGDLLMPAMSMLFFFSGHMAMNGKTTYRDRRRSVVSVQTSN